MRSTRARSRRRLFDLGIFYIGALAGCATEGASACGDRAKSTAAALEMKVAETTAAAPGEDSPQPGAAAAPSAARIRWRGRKQSTCNAPELAAGDNVTYVCDCASGSARGCVPGNDSNNGASPATPIRSFDAASRRFENLSPGGAIAFCRGGVFETDGRQWVNPKCRADMPCIVRDYRPAWAAADAPRPRIRSTNSVFLLENGGDAEPEQGYGFYNLELVGSGGHGDGTAVFVYNDVDDVTLCDLRIDGFRLAVHVGGANSPAPGSDGKNERIALRDSEILNNGKQGFLGGCNGCVIENNYFENNGFQHAILDHNIYISGSKDVVSRGERIVNNEIYRSTRINNRCEGASVVVHGRHEDMLIEGNLVREDLGAAAPQCWGIAVDPGYDEAELFRSVVIRGNVVHNVGNVGIGVASCQNCVIESNVVVQEQAIGGCAIAAPNRERESGDAQLDQVKIRNNSIFSRSPGGCGIKLGGEGAGHELSNNAVLHLGGAEFSCFDLIDGENRFAHADRNVCFYKRGAWAEGIGPLEKVRSRRSIDGSSRFVDPGFRSVSGPLLDLAPAGRESPLVDAADAAHTARSDADSAPRDAKPDIGAYELR